MKATELRKLSEERRQVASDTTAQLEKFDGVLKAHEKLVYEDAAVGWKVLVYPHHLALCGMKAGDVALANPFAVPDEALVALLRIRAAVRKWLAGELDDLPTKLEDCPQLVAGPPSRQQRLCVCDTPQERWLLGDVLGRFIEHFRGDERDTRGDDNLHADAVALRERLGNTGEEPVRYADSRDREE